MAPLGGSHTLNIYENAVRFCVCVCVCVCITLVGLCLVDLDIFQGMKDQNIKQMLGLT